MCRFFRISWMSSSCANDAFWQRCGAERAVFCYVFHAPQPCRRVFPCVRAINGELFMRLRYSSPADRTLGASRFGRAQHRVEPGRHGARNTPNNWHDSKNHYNIDGVFGCFLWGTRVIPRHVCPERRLTLNNVPEKIKTSPNSPKQCKHGNVIPNSFNRALFEKKHRIKVKLHYACKVRNIGRVCPRLRFCALC